MNPTDNQTLDFAREIPFDQILTNPILDIAARLWETDRYDAFKICYRSMRRLDDLVDHRKETGEPINAAEVELFTRMMADWVKQVAERKVTDPFVAQMVETTDRFAIPLWPWERLVRSMVYDLTHNGYASFLQFLRYTEGAAISPAAIFMHLIGLPKVGDLPAYDIREGARALALFSYLVHIVRDFQKDHKANLNYFCDDLMTRAGVSRTECTEIAHSEEPTKAFRRLIAEYVRLAEFYRQKARRKIDSLLPLLEPRYQLSLELIYQLYEQIFAKIDPEKGNFSGAELNPSEAEIKERIDLTIDRFVPVSAG